MSITTSLKRLVSNLIVALLCFHVLPRLSAQAPVSQVEGFLEVYHPDDTTSVFIGKNAGQAINTSAKRFNTFIGASAGFSNSDGSSNSFYGESAGFLNTEGNANSFFGVSAGRSNTIGSANSFFGDDTGRTNTTGEDNSFFGSNSGRRNTTGSSNTFLGYNTAVSNTEGSMNTFIGTQAGEEITTQNQMIIIGANAGPENVSVNASMQLFIDVEQTDNPLIFGDFSNDILRVNGNMEVYHPDDTTSLYVGKTAGQVVDNSTRKYHTFVGSESGKSNTTGSFNSFFGFKSGTSNTTGGFNSFFGVRAGMSNTTALDNSFFGHDSGSRNTTGDRNSFFGYSSGFGNTTGVHNSFFGGSSGSNNITGAYNTFIGDDSGDANRTGSFNTIMGAMAGSTIVDNNKMIIIGANAGPTSPAPTDSMQLFIDVEMTDSPLIFGDFHKDELTVYGKQLEISDDITPTLRFDRSGTSNGTQRFDFEIAMDGGDMIFQGGRDGSGVDLDTIMRIKANGNITGKVVEISDDDSPLLRFDRSGVKFDFEITMDGPDMIFQGGRSGTGAQLDTLVRIDDDGNITSAGTITGIINNISDINKKELIIPIRNSEILEKINNLPISEWQYKGSSDRHIGPMAQDFYAAFGLGQGERTIATVDADGVALAAIQALAKENKTLKSENEVLKKMYSDLLKRIERLEDAQIAEK